jgi:hypothetical protein
MNPWRHDELSNSDSTQSHSRFRPEDGQDGRMLQVLSTGGSGNLYIFTIKLVYFIFDLLWPPGTLRIFGELV